MNPDSITKCVQSEAKRLELTDIELAAMLGVSLPRATSLRRKGTAPRTTRLARVCAAFLARAKRARSRTDLTLPAAA